MQFMVENEEKINMMNRIIIGLLTVAAASCFGAVASAGNGANTNVVCNQYCAYQDADGDGICDNQGNCGRNYADADKDGRLNLVLLLSIVHGHDLNELVLYNEKW